MEEWAHDFAIQLLIADLAIGVLRQQAPAAGIYLDACVIRGVQHSFDDLVAEGRVLFERGVLGGQIQGACHGRFLLPDS